MMNAARLVVAGQGVCSAEASLQIAEAYAAERVQGTAPNSTTKGPDTIDKHPDVQRMLMTQKAFAQGGRALILRATLAHDMTYAQTDAAAKEDADDLLQLLTPVAKAFLTDAGNEASSLGVQVLGGHGYIREWGVEQWMRDVRIAGIYEGTNGIQALDLVGRKLSMKGGALPEKYFKQCREDFLATQKNVPFAAKAIEALNSLEALTADVQKAGPTEKAEVASDYLAIFGLVALAHEWVDMASVSKKLYEDDTEFHGDKIATAEFYLSRILPRYLGHIEAVRAVLSA